jgi:hypothetical protein
MATPSLLLIPDRYKSGVLYSQLPESGAGDIDFTRASAATRVNASGLIESVASGVPRLDYTGGGCPSLLLEPQRTNLLTYSEEFDNADWSKDSGVTVAANVAISPDGSTNADRVSYASENTAIYRIISGVSTEHQFSVYLKGEGANIGKQINLEASTNINVTLTGEWQRFVTTSNDGVVAIKRLLVGQADAVLVWGAQFEAGAYPTSYIKTTSAAVTRAADEAGKTAVSGLIGQQEGTWYADLIVLGNTGNATILNSANVVTNAISLHIESNAFRGYVFANSVNLNNIVGGSVVIGGTYKVAYAYKSGDAALYVNGVQIGVASQSFAFTASIDTIKVSDTVTFFSTQEGIKINTAALYTTRLSNSELAALTAL